MMPGRNMQDSQHSTHKQSVKLRLDGNKLSFLFEISSNDIINFKICTLPTNIQENLHHLTHIDLSHSNLSKIPDSFSELPSIKHFNISHNAFEQVPDCFYINLYRIEYFDISHNLITQFSPPNCILSLTILKLNNNKFELMPSWLWESSVRLKELDLSGNSFSMREYGVMYKTFFSTSRLVWLSVANCHFSDSDSKVLSRIPNLLYLNIGNDKLDSKQQINSWDIPISNLHCKNNLQILDAKNLYLSTLPNNIDELKNLTNINLKNNSLHWVPDNFSKLSNLKLCDLSSNNLSYLTDTFLNLSNLTELYLANNNFTKLPDLQTILKLKILDVYNNNLETVSEELINQVYEIDIEQNYVSSSCDNLGNKTLLLRKRLNEVDSRKNGCKILVESEKENEDEENELHCYARDYSSDEYDNKFNEINFVDQNGANTEFDEDDYWNTKYLDDHYVPSPIGINYFNFRVPSPVIMNYDLNDLFRDAD